VHRGGGGVPVWAPPAVRGRSVIVRLLLHGAPCSPSLAVPKGLPIASRGPPGLRLLNYQLLEALFSPAETVPKGEEGLPHLEELDLHPVRQRAYPVLRGQEASVADVEEVLGQDLELVVHRWVADQVHGSTVASAGPLAAAPYLVLLV
jgi:hypothetical protein